MKKKVIIGAISLVFLFYLSFLWTRLSDRPSFCKSCHLMKPYVENWETSSHNFTGCIKCHYEPGFRGYIGGKFRLITEAIRYFLGVYNVQLHSRVSDKNCMQCHIDEELEVSEVMFAKRIIFRHKNHYKNPSRGIELPCAVCHSELVQGRHLSASVEPCIICHFTGSPTHEPLGGCGVCHGPPRDAIFIRGITFNHSEYLKTGVRCNTCHIYLTKGKGDVPGEKCITCHIERFEEYGNPELLHKVHVTEEKIKCLSCHTEIKHGSIEILQSLVPECSGCHGAEHQVQEAMYIGTGGKAGENFPDPMFLSGVACSGCHQTEIKENKVIFLPKAKPSACVSCHGKGYDRLLRMWQKEVRDRVKNLRDSKEKIEKVVSASGIDKYSSSLNTIRLNLQFIIQDKSYGGHNIRYVNLLLDEVEKDLSYLENRILKRTTADLPSILTSYSQTPSCFSCHYGVQYAKREINSKTFGHREHLKANTCRNCHSSKYHGVTFKSAKDCNSCHHREKEKCKRCHSGQNKIYTGKIEGYEGEPDFMAQAGLTCQDCHIQKGEIKRPSPRDCADCHDESYSEMMKEKQKEFRNMIKVLKEKMEEEQKELFTNKFSLEVYLSIEKNRETVKRFEKDGSYGMHNMVLFEDVLNKLTSHWRGKPGKKLDKE